MEDFSVRNGVTVNIADGLTIGQVENIVESLAGLYAWTINEGQVWSNGFFNFKIVIFADIRKRLHKRYVGMGN